MVEAYLDKGRGYVSTILVQTGTLKIGDYILAGKHSGKVKAMFDERGNHVDEAIAFNTYFHARVNGAPNAGDNFNVMEDEREAEEYRHETHPIITRTKRAYTTRISH